MARKYDTVELDTITYEKHGTKITVAGVATKVGFAPVRTFGDDDPFINFVKCANAAELQLIISDWKYGAAVRIQGMVRRAATGGGYTDADHNKIFNEMSSADPEWLMQYAGNGAALDAACRAEWDRRKAENPVEADEERVWEEYATPNAAEIEIN